MGAGAAIGPLLMQALPALAVSAAGALFNNNIQNKAISEQNNQNRMTMQLEEAARTAEQARQLGMEESQVAAVNAATDASDPGDLRKTVEAYAAQPNEFTDSANAYNLDHLQGQISTGETSETIGKTVGDAIAKTREILRNQSILTQQGVGFGGMADAATRMRDEVSNVGSNRRRSAGVAQMETTLPTPQVTPSKSILGDILLAGGGLLAGGIGGAAGGAGGAAGTAVGAPLNAIPWLGPLKSAQFGGPLT